MEKNEWINKMENQLSELGLKFSMKQINKYLEYMNLLIEENKNMNLTAITQPEEVLTKHFIDSLTILKYCKEGESIIDVGTGAGLPGIPLNLSNKNLNIMLIDSLNKRVQFLEKVIKELKLDNIKAIHTRAEDMSKQKEYREQFDIATSRAVASLNVLLEYLLPFVKIGGKCICMKGSNIKEEVDSSKKALEILGGKIEKIEEITLPNTDMKRNIIIVKKVKGTPSKYPRKAGMPTKNPIV